MEERLGLAVAALFAACLAPSLGLAQGECIEFASVAAGGDQVVATGPGDGRVSRWGSHAAWQSGVPEFTQWLGAELPAVEVVAGKETVYARLRDGRVLSWGRDALGSGSLGRDLGGGDQDENPDFVRGLDGASELTGVIDLAAGDRHVLARLIDGTLVAWGENSAGQLGDGTNADSDRPVRVLAPDGLGPLIGSRAIAAGAIHSLALRADGTLVSWGGNGAGQAGNGSASSSLPLEVLPPLGFSRLQDIIDIASGAHHGLARRDDGALFAWGRGNRGQLGAGNRNGSARPAIVFDEEGSGPVVGASAIAAGAEHSLAIVDGRVLSWGANDEGQLGAGLAASLLERSLPGPVLVAEGVELHGVQQLAAGRAHSLALRSGPPGDLFAWGAGENGQLGDGLFSHSAFARSVSLPGLEEPSAVDLEPAALPLTVSREGDWLRLAWDGGLDGRFALTTGSLDLLRDSGTWDGIDLAVVEGVSDFVAITPVQDAWFLALGACGDLRSSAGRDDAGNEREQGTADPDRDGDGIANVLDVCPDEFDPEQRDADGDGEGDACDESTPTPDAQFLIDGAVTSPEAGGVNLRVQGTGFVFGDGLRLEGSGGQGVAEVCELRLQSFTEMTGIAPRYFTPGGPFPAEVDLLATRGELVDETTAVDLLTGRPFRYFANPRLLAATGPEGDHRVRPSQVVTVTGLNFMPERDQFVGSVRISNSGLLGGNAAGEFRSAVPFTVNDNNQLVFGMPFLPVNDFFDITIRTPFGGLSCTEDYSFTLVAGIVMADPPQAAAAQPARGPWFGGTEVRIVGEFLVPVDEVRLGGVAQPILAQDTTSVTISTQAVTEDAAGVPLDVVLTGLGGESLPLLQAFTYIAEPDVAGVTRDTLLCGPLTHPPNVLPVETGATLTLTGSDLAGVNAATLGGMPAAITAVSDEAFRIEVPAEPLAGGPVYDLELSATFPEGPGGAQDAPFVTSFPVALRYLSWPVVNDLTPTTVAAGSFVTISGSDLLNASGELPLVSFGGVPVPEADIAVSPDGRELLVRVPPGPEGQAVQVRVETCQGSTFSPVLFGYPCEEPVVDAMTPESGSFGTLVAITGSHLLSADGIAVTVTFDGVPAVVNLFTSTAERLDVTVPIGDPGRSVAVLISTCGTEDVFAGFFTYDCDSPQVVGIAPTQGRAGTVVTLSGSNLDSPDGTPVEVLFGMNPAVVDLAGSSDTELVVIVPVGVGAVSLRVTTCGGSTTFSSPPFSYCNAPRLDSLTPAAGPPGTVVALSGASFIAPNGDRPAVLFGGEPATVLETPIPSNASLSVEAPAGTGTVDVTLETCGGRVLELGAYTYP
jgi:alpha-tubulin suppressor-like RCC1 family protein